MSYSFLVADDERLARNYLHNLITEAEPTAMVYEAKSAAEARAMLRDNEINVLFLDIKMPGEDGMQLLESLHDRNFELIITTAYSDYALRAIKENALDYLLKPIKITEFREALDKALRRLKMPVLTEDEIKRERALRQTLTINTHRGTMFAPVRQIVYIQADNTYTNLFMTGGEKITTTRPIRKLEETLDNQLFFRIHKSYIVNLFHFREIESRIGDVALMDNGARLPVSRYRLKAFTEFVSNNTMA